MFVRAGQLGWLIGAWGVGVVVIGFCAGCGEDRLEAGPVEATLVFGEVGRQDGQFSYPRAMCGWSDDAGDWLVVIDKTARVQLFDAATGLFVGGFRMPRLDRGKPTGVTVGPMPGESGRRVLYVADTHEHRVLGFDVPAVGSDPDTIGEPVFELGSYGEEDGQFVYPTDVVVLVDGGGRAARVYISEYGGNDRVSCFEPVVDDVGGVGFVFLFAFGEQGGVEEGSGQWAMGNGEEGEEEGEGVPGGTPVPREYGEREEIRFNRPQDLVVDRAREQLLVCDAINHRVGRFSLDGGLIGWFGSAGRGAGEFDHPYSLAMLSDGTALVCEFGAGRVQRVDARTGEPIGQTGEPGRGDGQLGNPWEVVVLGEHAFVLDSGNNRVMRFDIPDGVRAANIQTQRFESLGLGAGSEGDS